jgi:hypothetical protein
MLKACRTGVASVPPPVPVNAARQPIADATPIFATPCGGARDHKAVLQEALVGAHRHHEQREDHLQQFSGGIGQQRGPDQDADQDPDRPGPEERQVEIAQRELLAGRSDRARQHQRHRRPHRHVHHDRMRHAEQRQQVDKQRNPHDAAADAEQTGDEPGPHADQREYADPLRHSIHPAPLKS